MIDYNKYQNLSITEYESVAGSDWPEFSTFMTHQNIPQEVYDELDSMLWGLEPFNNTAFCILPFYGRELMVSGERTTCCLMSRGYDLNDVKEYMLSNQRHPACSHCWDLESLGLVSDRQIKNADLDFSYQKDIKKIYEECKQGLNNIICYKIDTSNICNATCTTCNESASSSWAILKYKNKVINVKPSITKNSTEGFINYISALTVGFRGGESLLSDQNFDILEQLLEHRNTNCHISFTTNGSVTLKSWQHKILSKFNHVIFCISIDGVGPVFEYMRYPLTWDKLLENINVYKTHGYDIAASYTVSNLNLLYYHETTKWFENHNIPYLVNPVKTPSWFQPSALPKNVKQRILTLNPESSLKPWLRSHCDQDDIAYQKFLVEIDRQDRWKRIDISNYLPELTQLLGI